MNSEFEKWFQRNFNPLLDFKPPVEDAWKAALEWVLNHPNLIDHYQLDYVKEELEKLL